MKPITRYGLDSFDCIVPMSDGGLYMRDEADARIAELTAKVASLRIALKFYANDANWSSISVMERGPAVDEDGGDIARNALKEGLDGYR